TEKLSRLGIFTACFDAASRTPPPASHVATSIDSYPLFPVIDGSNLTPRHQVLESDLLGAVSSNGGTPPPHMSAMCFRVPNMSSRRGIDLGMSLVFDRYRGPSNAHAAHA
ncbi:hypothetical protein E4U43_005011, partial [Claviceps pusilla]